jgi:hypothetical protein
MLDRSDLDFANNLRRVLLKALNGDDNTTGLYRAVVGSQTFEQFKFTAGMINAYESVLNEMNNIARRMNGDEDQQRERNQTDRNLS